MMTLTPSCGVVIETLKDLSLAQKERLLWRAIDSNWESESLADLGLPLNSAETLSLEEFVAVKDTVYAALTATIVDLGNTGVDMCERLGRLLQKTGLENSTELAFDYTIGSDYCFNVIRANPRFGAYASQARVEDFGSVKKATRNIIEHLVESAKTASGARFDSFGSERTRGSNCGPSGPVVVTTDLDAARSYLCQTQLYAKKGDNKTCGSIVLLKPSLDLDILNVKCDFINFQSERLMSTMNTQNAQNGIKFQTTKISAETIRVDSIGFLDETSTRNALERLLRMHRRNFKFIGF